MAGFPFVVGHTVNDFLCLAVVDLKPPPFRLRRIPFGQAVAAEVGDEHEIDVLNLGMILEVLDESAENGGFDFGLKLLAHQSLLKRVCYSIEISCEAPPAMKLLVDFFPVVLFFLAYKLYDIYAATAVLMGATTLQIGGTWLFKRRVEAMQWVTLLLVLLFGGVTLLLHNELYIKWKPTVVNLLFGLVFLASHFTSKPLIQRILAQNIELPKQVWSRLNLMWTLFFFFLAAANLLVVYAFSTEVWVNFKLFGMLGLTVIFVVLQTLYLARHVQEV